MFDFSCINCWILIKKFYGLVCWCSMSSFFFFFFFFSLSPPLNFKSTLVCYMFRNLIVPCVFISTKHMYCKIKFNYLRQIDFWNWGFDYIAYKCFLLSWQRSSNFYQENFISLLNHQCYGISSVFMFHQWYFHLKHLLGHNSPAEF